MDSFDPPISLTISFIILTLSLVTVEVWLVRTVAPTGRTASWRNRAVGAAAAWLITHALVAESGVLEIDTLPPTIPVYWIATMTFSVMLVRSTVGKQLSMLPLGILVGLMAYRLPLEILLHLLYESGDLPVQMTWSGRNWDVITGVLGLILGVVSIWRVLPWGLVLAFNVLGLALLLNVVTITLLSAPLSIRQFLNDPPVVLVFHAPYNWIVNVHVWTALTGHLLIFRALSARRGHHDAA